MNSTMRRWSRLAPMKPFLTLPMRKGNHSAAQAVGEATSAAPSFMQSRGYNANLVMLVPGLDPWIVAGIRVLVDPTEKRSNDRSHRRGNRTALISLGIPKLVRFNKIRFQQSIVVLLWYFYTFNRRDRAMAGTERVDRPWR